MSAKKTAELDYTWGIVPPDKSCPVQASNYFFNSRRDAAVAALLDVGLKSTGYGVDSEETVVRCAEAMGYRIVRVQIVEVKP